MRKSLVLAASAAALIVTSGFALAAGSGGSSGGASGGSDSTTCKKGFMWDKKSKKCVQQDSMILPDQDLIEQAWALSRKGEFDAGRALFNAVADKRNPEVLNGLGYTNRKLGHFSEAIAYYKKALSVDPHYAQAREYLGEGYVTMGKIDLAREQLAEIGKICGATCEEYVDLKDAIDTAVKQAGAQ